MAANKGPESPTGPSGPDGPTGPGTSIGSKTGRNARPVYWLPSVHYTYDTVTNRRYKAPVGHEWTNRSTMSRSKVARGERRSGSARRTTRRGTR